MIPCHMFLLPFPAMILPHILQLRSIYKFSPMKIQVWLLLQWFLSHGTISLVTEACIPSNICFAMFIHSPLQSLQQLQNVKYINVRHIYMWRLKDVQEKYNPISEPDTDSALKVAYSHPGDCVFVDYFEYYLKGPILTSFVLSYSEQWVGGYIFVDHASGYLHIEHKLGF